MKKVAFMFVAAMAISFASCGGQATATTEAAADTLAETVDSAAAEVAETAQEVVAE